MRISASTTCFSLGFLPFAFVLAAPSPRLLGDSVIDTYKSPASFALPCPHCLGSQSLDLASSLDLSLDFGVSPGLNPCASNLTLNSIPLQSTSHWDFEPKFDQGSTSVNASGNELILSWFTACNTTSDQEYGAQLLTVNVHSVNGTSVDQSSLAGFTLTFKDTNPPKLLRYTHHPISPSEIDPILYIPVVDIESENSDSDSELPLTLFIGQDQELEDELNNLRRLKAQLTELEKAVTIKQNQVHDRLYDLLKQQINECEGSFCKVKAVFKHFHTSINVFFLKAGASEDAIFQAASLSGHSQKPTMVSTTSYPDEKKSDPSDLPTKPEECHCRDRPVSSTPSTAPPPYDESGAHNGQFKDAQPPSTFSMILKFLLVVSGLALIYALIRRCCTSPRRRRDRLARREQRRREKEYRCASRRQAFWDVLRGRRRGTPGRRVGDFDEKARLVGPQEAILEQQMQDEIHQLKIHEEIAQIRSARDVVDELIRAEEGRIVPPSYSPPSVPGPSHYSGYRTGVVPVPRPIMIPSRPSTNESDISSPISDIGPFSPISRTTSLPSYRSKPPSYREDLSSNDGFSDCDLSADSISDAEGEEWRSDSSIPDLSPRPSGETVRTFL